MGRLRLGKDLYAPYVTRDEWGAVHHKLFKAWALMELPITHVRLSYDDILRRYNTHEHIKALQLLQKDDMERDGFEDIKYNFMVNSEGVVYEGRGFFMEPIMPKKYASLQYKLLEIVFMGDFSKEDPPWPMLRGAMQVVQYGLKNLYIDCASKMIPLRDINDPTTDYSLPI